MDSSDTGRTKKSYQTGPSKPSPFVSVVQHPSNAAHMWGGYEAVRTNLDADAKSDQPTLAHLDHTKTHLDQTLASMLTPRPLRLHSPLLPPLAAIHHNYGRIRQWLRIQTRPHGLGRPCGRVKR